MVAKRPSKEKQEKTLAQMKERRKEDSRILRAVLEDKLRLCTKELNYGKEKLKNLEITKRMIQQQVLRLEGAIEIIQQTLNPKEDKLKEGKTE